VGLGKVIRPEVHGLVRLGARDHAELLEKIVEAFSRRTILLTDHKRTGKEPRSLVVLHTQIAKEVAKNRTIKVLPVAGVDLVPSIT